MRRRKAQMATPVQITLRRREIEEWISTLAGLAVLVIIYSKILGLW